MVEAAIALPVLVLLLVAVAFVRERYLGRQQALLAARRCAWTHAIEGCGDPPEGCDSGLSSAAERTDSTLIASAARERTGAKPAIDVFDGIPVLGDAIAALFGTFTRASAQSATAQPGSGGDAVLDRAEQVVLCNEQPRDVQQAARNVFCTHVPLVPCEGD